MNPGPAVAVEGLVKRYGGRAVVDGLSFEVAAGELVAILGPNGAGKTTTVEAVEGYRRPDAGRVRVLDEDVTTGRRGRELRARLGLMLQGGGFDPRSRPRETLEQFAAFHAEPLEVGPLLERVGLTGVAGTAWRRLSGGERQRLSLAVALVGRPDVLVLDEPTAGMDPEARAVTRALVEEARAGGAAILLTSHDLTDVERLADRILVLDGGRIVAAGSPAALTAAAQPSITVRVDRVPSATELAAIAAALLAALGVPGSRGPDIETLADPREIRVTGLPADEAGLRAAVAVLATACASGGLLVVELRTGAATLEEAYLAILRASRAEGRA